MLLVWLIETKNGEDMKLTLRQIATKYGYKNVDDLAAILYVRARTLRGWLDKNYKGTIELIEECHEERLRKVQK